MINTWQEKAHSIIGKSCRASYLAANTRSRGGLYKRHRSYSIDPLIQELVECLKRDDKTKAEQIMKNF